MSPDESRPRGAARKRRRGVGVDVFFHLMFVRVALERGIAPRCEGPTCASCHLTTCQFSCSLTSSSFKNTSSLCLSHFYFTRFVL